MINGCYPCSSYTVDIYYCYYYDYTTKWYGFCFWFGWVLFLAVFHAPVPKFYNINDFFVLGTFLGMQNYVKESDLGPQWPFECVFLCLTEVWSAWRCRVICRKGTGAQDQLQWEAQKYFPYVIFPFAPHPTFMVPLHSCLGRGFCERLTQVTP